MKPSDVLREAKALISSPRNWIRGDMARDVDGRVVDVNHISATCFCAEGAIIRTALNPIHAERFLEEALDAAGVECFDEDGDPIPVCIPAWNDAAHTTHSMVMRAFDAAIAIAEAEEKSE